MSKRSNNSDRPGGIEIQRGKINMNGQYNAGFPKETTREDMRNIDKRVSGMELTKHVPKR